MSNFDVMKLKDSDNEFFHPLRYVKSRPYCHKLFEKYKSDNLYVSDRLNEQMGDMMNIFNSEIHKYQQPLRSQLIEQHIGNPVDIMNQELSFLVDNQRLRHRGNNIFYFPEGISTLFKHTDVSEISIGNIKFPYKTFYIAFGPQLEFDIGFDTTKEYFFDGAYIDQIDEKVLSIRLTSARIDRDYKTQTNWFKYPDVSFWIGLEFDSPEDKLVNAVNGFINQALENFKKWEDIPKEVEIDGEIIPTNPLSNESPTRQRRINRIVTNAEKFKEIANLIFNAICYLTFQDKEITTSFTNNPPKTLLDKVKKAKKPREKQRIEEELKKSPFTRIKICGQSISNETTNSENNPTGKELSTHWRRGHWRNQAFGQEAKERKLIWIRPTLVRKDKGDAKQGHIYTAT